MTKLESKYKDTERELQDKSITLEQSLNEKDAELKGLKNKYDKDQAINTQKWEFLEQTIKELRSKLESQKKDYTQTIQILESKDEENTVEREKLEE